MIEFVTCTCQSHTTLSTCTTVPYGTHYDTKLKHTATCYSILQHAATQNRTLSTHRLARALHLHNSAKRFKYLCCRQPLQHTATHTVIQCDTLQHSHCNAGQHTTAHTTTLSHGKALQHTAAQRYTQHHTATQRNTLQHNATHCSTLLTNNLSHNNILHTPVCCRQLLQHTATHLNTLQHTTAHF